jgi:hypothetical protein
VEGRGGANSRIDRDAGRRHGPASRAGAASRATGGRVKPRERSFYVPGFFSFSFFLVVEIEIKLISKLFVSGLGHFSGKVKYLNSRTRLENISAVTLLLKDFYAMVITADFLFHSQKYM